MVISNIRSLAKFHIGMAVRHRVYGFRGIIFDVDPVFNNTEEWYLKIPEERRPDKNQPFYHLLAENEDKTTYVAYVSQQNLENDDSNEPFKDPTVNLLFDGNDKDGNYIVKQSTN